MFLGGIRSFHHELGEKKPPRTGVIPSPSFRPSDNSSRSPGNAVADRAAGSPLFNCQNARPWPNRGCLFLLPAFGRFSQPLVANFRLPCWPMLPRAHNNHSSSGGKHPFFGDWQKECLFGNGGANAARGHPAQGFGQILGWKDSTPVEEHAREIG